MNAPAVQTPAASVYGDVQLGYVLVDSPRLQEWKRFAVDGIGMALGDETTSTLACRIDAQARRLIVRKSPEEDIALGWRVGAPHALDTILSRLAAREIAVEAVGGEQAALRGVPKFWRFVGPKRQAFELYAEAEVAPPARTLASAFVTGERGLGHVAITTRKPQAMVAFWQEIFDARVSDFIEDRINGVDLKITFLRVNSRHHSIAVAATKGVAMDPFRTKIQHLEMQAASLNDIGEAYRRCREIGFKIAMAVGQHTNDRDVSFYAVTPSGFYFELGYASAGEDVREAWPQVTHQGISVWGHKPLDQSLGDRLAQMRNGVTSLLRAEYSPY
jgi:2,3-dihydroxybiphenyl 1,2-dioxygenase